MGCFSCFCCRRGNSGGSNPSAFHFTPPFNDPFALPHLSDQHNMPPIESTYRTKSGLHCLPLLWLLFPFSDLMDTRRRIQSWLREVLLCNLFISGAVMLKNPQVLKWMPMICVAFTFTMTIACLSRSEQLNSKHYIFIFGWKDVYEFVTWACVVWFVRHRLFTLVTLVLWASNMTSLETGNSNHCGLGVLAPELGYTSIPIRYAFLT